MIADRCEINRQIRADNKMLRELKAKVAKLAEAVEKSIPIIAETLEAIRNHMIFTQYHLLHNEMQKEVIHDWMNHFNPILNKYNTVKKKLKAKVTERKELNVQKDKTSILNPIQHIKLNQQLTTITEEIEELKSRKEQLIFQAECSTDKDMTNLSKKYDQMNKNLDILDSQDISLKKQLEKDAAVILQPMRWIISMLKILMFFPIVPGNLNIRGNRRCDGISLFDLRKSLWNCSIFKGV